MSLDTLNNGDSGLQARTKINAAIAALPLVRGTGLLRGPTNPGSAAAAPADVIIDFSSATPTNSGYIRLGINGTGYSIYISPTDPSQTYWIDTSDASSIYDLAARFAANVPSLLGSICTANDNLNGSVTVSISNTGSSAELGADTEGFAGANSSGGGFGLDMVEASGGINEVELIPAATGKTIKMVSAQVVQADLAGDVYIQLAIKVGYTYTPISQKYYGSAGAGVLAPDSDTLSGWLNGVINGSLTAWLVDSSGSFTSATGDTTATIWFIAEQR